MSGTQNNKILIIEIVEDENSQRKVLTETFVRSGFNVLQARDGKEGLEIALKEKPDIILLDILMPDMDGMTMLGKLRHYNSWGKNVPVILLTNISPDNEKINKQVVEDEPAYYLMKANYTIDDIVDKVKERLNR